MKKLILILLSLTTISSFADVNEYTTTKTSKWNASLSDLSLESLKDSIIKQYNSKTSRLEVRIIDGNQKDTTSVLSVIIYDKTNNSEQASFEFYPPGKTKIESGLKLDVKPADIWNNGDIAIRNVNSTSVQCFGGENTSDSSISIDKIERSKTGKIESLSMLATFMCKAGPDKFIKTLNINF